MTDAMSESYWYYQVTTGYEIIAVRRDRSVRRDGVKSIVSSWAYVDFTLGVEIPFASGERRTNIRPMSAPEVLSIELKPAYYAWVGTDDGLRRSALKTAWNRWYRIGADGRVIAIAPPESWSAMAASDAAAASAVCANRSLLYLIEAGKGTIAMPTDGMTDRRSQPDEPNSISITVRRTRRVEMILDQVAHERALVDYVRASCAAELGDSHLREFTVELDNPRGYGTAVVIFTSTSEEP